MKADLVLETESSHLPVARETKPQDQIVPTAEDLKVTDLVVAVHGIGKQFRYSTIQAVAHRFASYCRRPITQPLGAFHPNKVILEPDSPELGAYLFEAPANSEQRFQGFGFAESFWADIPEIAAATKNTTEETKAWAQTVVERVRTLDQSKRDHSNLIDYNKASAVVEEMIDTIKVLENLLFVASKAGLFEFNLGQLLTDFVGCVQIVADFKDYGGNVFDRFAITMRNLVRRMPNLKKIYIVAHSEGTVVSFKGLLTALAAPKSPDNKWVDLVKGYMTIGSPLNKHIVMWPKLWQDLRPAPGRSPQDPILWRNYYDFGDPVGFDLEISREWMQQNGWLSADEAKGRTGYFQFGNDDDYGFTRYPFPGEAHNDYWNDDKVFGHFINDVVLKNGKAEKPRTIPWAVFVSYIVPYLVCLVLLVGGTYVLYQAVVTAFFKSESNPVPVLWNVSGITCLLAGVTLLSRLPRLEKVWPSGAIGVVAFVSGVVGYLTLVSPDTQKLLSSAFVAPNGIIWFFLLTGLVSAVLSKCRPKWGMKPLIGLGGVAALLVLSTLIQKDPSALDRSLWALVLANGAFLYLWWLSASIFDLVFIWHRYIRSFRTTKILSTLRAEAPSHLKA
jgi:hypothetical protein